MATIADAPPHSRAAIASLARPLVLGTAAGLMLALSYAIHPLWWTAWLAPVPLAAARSIRDARIAGTIAGALAISVVLPYYIGQLGWIPMLLIALLRIGSWRLAARLTHAAATTLPLSVAMVMLPATVAALELVTMLISPHGAAGSMAYSQMTVPAVIQVAAIGGVPAIVFLVLLPGSLAGLLLSRRWPATDRTIATALLLVIGSLVTLFAVHRLSAPAGRQIRVTMIATDRFPSIPRDWAAVWTVYGAAVTQSAPRGGIVVLPEKIVLLDPLQVRQAVRDVAEAARTTGATIVAGVETRDAKGFRNRAMVVAPNGHAAWYDKQRTVPGFENRDIPGKTPLLIDAAGTRLGTAICKDMHIPSIGRDYAGDAALLAVPAWDFGQDGWMGARMTALRGVEGGYAVARSARGGLLGAYDAKGRAIAERESKASMAGDGMTIVQAIVPAVRIPTFYGRVGDLFGWGCVFVMLLLARMSIRRRSIAADA